MKRISILKSIHPSKILDIQYVGIRESSRGISSWAIPKDAKELEDNQAVIRESELVSQARADYNKQVMFPEEPNFLGMQSKGMEPNHSTSTVQEATIPGRISSKKRSQQ